jgi:hypothetical protein
MPASSMTRAACELYRFRERRVARALQSSAENGFKADNARGDLAGCLGSSVRQANISTGSVSRLWSIPHFDRFVPSTS